MKLDDYPPTAQTDSEKLDAIVARVREIARANPDFVYEKPDPMGKCVNWYENENGEKVGSCIVGRALIDLGYPVTDQSPSNSATDMLYDLGLPGSNSQALWLRKVQIHQDGHRPWGRAVELASGEFPNV